MTLYIDLKPTLEWHIVRTQYTIEWRAKTPFGWYIHSNESDTPRLWFSINPDRDYHVYINYEIPDHKESKRFEAVRTAAQADYERRTAERFIPIGDLLERAAQLVGNPATNISGSTDLACAKWKEDYANIKTALDRAKGREYP